MDEELKTSSEEPQTPDDEDQNLSVSSDLIRGHINTIILRALYEGDKYGYEILADIESKSHGQYQLKQPSLYSALKRLEKEGCIMSYWGGSVNGGRRKYFSLTELGKEIAEKNQSEWEYSRTIIDSLISDKDFDFTNPAPNAVNMRLLRETTSRVPSSREDGEKSDEEEIRREQELSAREAELIARQSELVQRESALQAERESAQRAIEERQKALSSEQAWREQELSQREQEIERAKRELQERSQMTETEVTRSAELLRTKENQLAEANKTVETLLAERETAKTEAAQRLESERNFAQQQAAEERAAMQRTIQEERAAMQQAVQEERNRCRMTIEAERKRITEEETARTSEAIEQERQRYAALWEAEKKRILEEQEDAFRKREQELLHRNYIELIQSPPPPEPDREYSYYTPPVAEVPVREETPPPEENYRDVVGKIYENTVRRGETNATVAPATSLDGMDFQELKKRAAQDGIRITTAGGKEKSEETPSQNIVHKGKALFLSSLVAFLFCVALGSILIGVRSQFTFPAFYPYFVWCTGVALLLITGLAYANHYGERTIRRSSGIVIVNSVVIYTLCVIVTLIVSLVARVDFSDLQSLTTFVIVPLVYFLTVPIFGIVYYTLVRSKNN